MPCENCGKLVVRAPCDDAMDCFCHRCPRCNELIQDGRAVGALCETCDPVEDWPAYEDWDDLEVQDYRGGV